MDTNTLVMAIWLPIAIVAIVQASFSLSISVLTLLSGVSLANHRVKRGHGALMTSYVAGSVVVTLALLAGLAWMFRTTGWSDNDFVLMVLISALGLQSYYSIIGTIQKAPDCGCRGALPSEYTRRPNERVASIGAFCSAAWRFY